MIWSVEAVWSDVNAILTASSCGSFEDVKWRQVLVRNAVLNEANMIAPRLEQRVVNLFGLSTLTIRQCSRTCSAVFGFEPLNLGKNSTRRLFGRGPTNHRRRADHRENRAETETRSPLSVSAPRFVVSWNSVRSQR